MAAPFHLFPLTPECRLSFTVMSRRWAPLQTAPSSTPTSGKVSGVGLADTFSGGFGIDLVNSLTDGAAGNDIDVGIWTGGGYGLNDGDLVINVSSGSVESHVHIYVVPFSKTDEAAPVTVVA